MNCGCDLRMSGPCSMGSHANGIEFCPLHESASLLLAACEEMLERLRVGSNLWPGRYDNRMERILDMIPSLQAVIKAAKGEE